MKPKVIVIKTDGSNCEAEMRYAFALARANARIVHINDLFSGAVKLSDFQILALPGGFTYGDDIMSGKILANQLWYRLQESLQQFIQGDTLVLGVCNGFQVLVRSGLLPFHGEPAADASLIINDNTKFMSQWERLKINQSNSVFTKDLVGQEVEYPIANGEGKFIAANDAVVQKMKDNQQIVFTYVHNPNGSVADIAGISDSTGRILGLMPHPERFILKTQHYNWRQEPIEPQGLPLFQNAVRYFD